MINFLKYSSIILFFIHLSLPNAQTVQQSWLRLYDGTIGFESVYPAGGHAMTIDRNENVYVTESSFYNTNGVMVWATIKYNSSGTQQWATIYDEGTGINNKWAVPQGIAVDDSGNVYVTGQCNNDQTTFYHCVTVKYNSAGIQQWVQSLGNSDTSQGIKITLDKIGNVYVVGNFVHNTGGRHTLGTIKYNAAGTNLWQSYYTGYDFLAVSIAVDNSGNVYSFGNGYLQPNYGGACFYGTVKYNSSGQQLWAQQYTTGFGGGAIARDMVIDTLGNVYVTGAGISSATNYWDYTTIKYSSGGTQLWLQTYDNPSHGTDDAFSVAVDRAGNVSVAGFNSYNSGGYKITTVHYNSSGAQQWAQVYNEGPSRWENNLYGPLVRVDSASNIYMTGNICDSADNSYGTYKYSPSGVQQWMIKYREPVPDSSHYVKDMAVSPGGDVFVTGNQKGSGTYWDCVTIKYIQGPVGIASHNFGTPEQFSLGQNYPNPFNPNTTIKFNIPVGDAYMRPVHLVVYDILGREVATLVNRQMLPETYEVDFDGTNFPSGVYFYKLSAGNFVETRKMILLK